MNPSQHAFGQLYADTPRIAERIGDLARAMMNHNQSYRALDANYPDRTLETVSDWIAEMTYRAEELKALRDAYHHTLQVGRFTQEDADLLSELGD